ncbi:TetR/AcrR family transcriptional repressor of mexJK operon [Kibdelosporangium banguiense]|uniref:TetR/AcrR family transcriptional repressor of mexJK operon n=1 Tax=Kibdelosporangium banguiense TaxID=1365924 RepID=A0ABS4TLE8_9PSEU|nr:TetR/AcrR family transcriptional regulator [Kibdelosporangium banguiense]MBP2325249.1 TetR/AcrR family transcriptional repressor of mexJK operon [Kibdelosporangium banguiense]
MGIAGVGVGMEEGRSARKRRLIMEAATTLFLRNGYQGTSMDDVAALAAVSKQTVYKNFTDKEGLFSEIILGVSATVDAFVKLIGDKLHNSTDLAKDLPALARQYLHSILRPQVLQMRRLLVGEAARFPDLARTYYERAPERVLTALAPEFQHLAERGLLRVQDPALAAKHFAFLILGIALDKAMFFGDDTGFTTEELDHFADEGVRVFLAAYGGSAD